MARRNRQLLATAALLASAAGGLLIGHYAWEDGANSSVADGVETSVAGAGAGFPGTPTLPDPLPPRGPTTLRASRFATLERNMDGVYRPGAVTRVVWDSARDDRGVAFYTVITPSHSFRVEGALEATVGRSECDVPVKISVVATDVGGNRSQGASITITPTNRIVSRVRTFQGEWVNRTTCSI